jgi:hypothetical protein
MTTAGSAERAGPERDPDLGRATTPSAAATTASATSTATSSSTSTTTTAATPSAPAATISSADPNPVCRSEGDRKEAASGEDSNPKRSLPGRPRQACSLQASRSGDPSEPRARRQAAGRHQGPIWSSDADSGLPKAVALVGSLALAGRGAHSPTSTLSKCHKDSEGTRLGRRPKYSTSNIPSIACLASMDRRRARAHNRSANNARRSGRENPSCSDKASS